MALALYRCARHFLGGLFIVQRLHVDWLFNRLFEGTE